MAAAPDWISAQLAQLKQLVDDAAKQQGRVGGLTSDGVTSRGGQPKTSRRIRKRSAMPKSDAAEAVAGAYYIVQLLPLDPDQADAILAMVERALTQPELQPDGWSQPASYVFSHLQKSKPEMAAATLAVARDIIRAIRPHLA
jgi:hypothetical protein